MLNFIKKAVDNLTGSAEQTAQALRNALETTRNFLVERDGVFVKSSHPSTDFAATTDITVTPGKSGAELRATVTPVKGGEAARVEIVRTFDSAVIKNTSALATALDEAIDSIPAEAMKELSAKGISLFDVTYETYIDAVKSLSLKPYRELEDTIAVSVLASKELKVAWPFRIEIGAEEFTAYVEMYGIDTVAVAKPFESQGLNTDIKVECLTAYKRFPLKRISSTKVLAAAIRKYVDSAGKALADIHRRTSITADTFAGGIDADYLRSRLSVLDTFSKIDDDGDIKFVVPGDDSFARQCTVWVLPRAEKVSVQVRGTIDKEIDADTHSILRKYFPGIIADVSDGKTRGLELRVTLDDLRRDDRPQNMRLYEAVLAAVSDVRSAWQQAHLQMDIPCRPGDFFDKKNIERLLHTMGYETTKDDADDTRLTIPADSTCALRRFIWVMISPEKIKINGGILGTPSGIDAEKLAAEADAKFKGTRYTVGAYKDTVRLRGALEAKELQHNSERKEAIIKFLRESIDNIKIACAEPIRIYQQREAEERARLEAEKRIREEVEKYARSMRYSSDTDKDGDIQIRVAADTTCIASRFIWVMFKPDTIQVSGGISDYPSDTDTAKIAADAAAALKDTPFTATVVKDSVRLSGTLKLNPTGRDAARPEAVIDFVRDAIDKIKIACAEPIRIIGQRREEERRRREEEERRRREEEERRRREREERERREEEERKRAKERERQQGLGRWMTYDVDSSCTVGEIQKFFNDMWPYLRLGFFMVGHGKAADRSGSDLSSIDRDCTMGKVRSFKSSSTIRIEGSSTPDDIEKAFRRQTGLVVKICYTDDSNHRYYISKDSNYHKMPIHDLNALFDSRCYYYNDWY